MPCNRKAAKHYVISNWFFFQDYIIYWSTKLLSIRHLQEMEIAALKSTFLRAKETLDSIFNNHRHATDRFIRSGYDSLTVLYWLLKSEQQTEMYKVIQKCYADERDYIHTLKVGYAWVLLIVLWWNDKFYLFHFQHENLFWKVMLPEWALVICMEKFSMTKADVLKKINEQDIDANNNSFDLDYWCHFKKLTIFVDNNLTEKKKAVFN